MRLARRRDGTAKEPLVVVSPDGATCAPRFT